MLEIKNLTKTYKGGKTAVDNLSLTVRPGDIYGFIGHNGAGKTTTIKAVVGIHDFDSGEILVEGSAVNRHTATSVRKRIAMVFQNFNLFPNMTALENVTFGPIESLHKSKKEVVETGKMFLEKVGLADRMDSKPSQLSGGQQQRVAIGRALITRPKLILADEPTGNLDSKNSQDVMDLLTQAARHYQQTILMITHNNNLTASVDRVLRVTDGVLTDLGGNANERLS